MCSSPPGRISIYIPSASSENFENPRFLPLNYIPNFSFDELSPIRELDTSASFTNHLFERSDKISSLSTPTSLEPIPMTSRRHSTAGYFRSPSSIEETRQISIEDTVNRRPMRLFDSLEIPEWDPFLRSGSISNKLPRTPSAPMAVSSLVKKRLFKRPPLLRRLILRYDECSFYRLLTFVAFHSFNHLF